MLLARMMKTGAIIEYIRSNLMRKPCREHNPTLMSIPGLSPRMDVTLNNL